MSIPTQDTPATPTRPDIAAEHQLAATFQIPFRTLGDLRAAVDKLASKRFESGHPVSIGENGQGLWYLILTYTEDL